MYSDLLVLTLIIILTEKNVCGINFNVNKVVELGLDNIDKADGSYFGYSLLLQKGTNPIVIVGAPKHSNETGGAVFSCDILNGLGCTKYGIATTNKNSFNGNFLGAAIDGDENAGNFFVACAPRKVTQQGAGINANFFFRGSCFSQKNSSIFKASNTEWNPLKEESTVSRANNEWYYDYGFAQAGIDIVYDKINKHLILGATGIKNWNGAIVTQSLTVLSDHKSIPQKDAPLASENNDYLGYKVGHGDLLDTPFIFAGAPRADNLLGKVKLYNDNGNFRSFKGKETGAYFGLAVLAEDVNDDGVDDLFIGAPLTAGTTFDEGCVYFYKNSLTSGVKLVGTKQKSARFGTNIVALGDIDLDSYNDVAISAPYEDDGIGAVYIFMGRNEGIDTTYSQRLSPLSFPGHPLSVRGFGMGISRGNDIDGNGHNDLAIGAYLSGHVFVVQTKPVIDFRTALESDMTFISSNDSQITLRYCVYYKPRSLTFSLSGVDFHVKLSLDYRVKGKKIHEENITATPDATKCNTMDVQIRQDLVDIVPFSFVSSTTVIGDIMGEGTPILERQIPYAHGCGDDGICSTQVLLVILSDTNNIILGSNTMVDFNVTADNSGEPGYQCKLNMRVPKELDLRQKRQCEFKNSTYSCPFATILEKEKWMTVIFDILVINEKVKTLELTFEVNCLGENIDNKETSTIGILVQNSPSIKGISDPESYEYNIEDADDEKEVEMHHTFTLLNFGPSPVKSDVYLLLPIVKIGEDDLFHFIEAESNFQGIHVPCYPTNETKQYEKTYDVSTVVKAPLDRTTVVDCFEESSKCLELLCKGDYLYGSTESAKYQLKLKTKTKLLAQFFRNQDQSKNIMAYITSAFLFNGTRVEGHAATLVLSEHFTNIPIWVYIVSLILGILLLCLLVFVFYKCHFFDRRYKEKMNDECLMDKNVDMDAEVTTSSQENTEKEHE